MINVTKTYLPNKEKYQKYVDEIYAYGKCTQEFLLNSPNQGLLIEGLIWREMYNFSAGCVLLVLASEHYEEGDYIRDGDVVSTYTDVSELNKNFDYKPYTSLDMGIDKFVTWYKSFYRGNLLEG